MFQFPNFADVDGTGFENQSKPDKGDFEVMMDGLLGNGVYTDYSGNAGLEVRPQATPDMTVQVTPGSACVDGTQVLWHTGSATLTIGAADVSNPRTDLITLDTSGTLAVVAGTADDKSTWPAIPAGRIVLAQVEVKVGDTSIVAGNIRDKRAPIRFDNHYDVRNFGASGSRLQYTGTTSGATLNLNIAHDFKPGEGILIRGAGADNGLTGGSATLHVQGTPGSTTYEYEYAFGVGYDDLTDPTSVSQSTATGPATLDGTDFIEHRITPPSGCNVVAIYGRSAGTKDLLVVIPALVDNGVAYVTWEDKGDTVTYQQQTYRWRATSRYQEGMLIVDTASGTMHRVMRVIGDQMSNATVPAWDTVVNNMTSDDVGGETSELTWVNVQPHVPLQSNAGEIRQWHLTTVDSVESRTSLTLADAPITAVTSSPVYHSDIQRSKEAFDSLRDDAQGGRLVFGAPGYYNHQTGDVGNDPNMEDSNTAGGERTIYNLYLNEKTQSGTALHDKNDNWDVQRDGTRRSIEVVIETGAMIIALPGMDPAKNGGGSLDVLSSLFNPGATGLRFNGGGTISWWDFGCGMYERNDDAAGDGSGWCCWGQINDRWDMRISDLHVLYPQIHDDNGITFDDGFQRSRVIFEDCELHYGIGRDNRGIGLMHGDSSLSRCLVICDGYYGGDVVRADGGVTTELTVDNCQFRDWHRQGSASNANIGQAIDARGGSKLLVSNLVAEGFTSLEMSGTEMSLTHSHITNCNVVLKDGRRIICNENTFDDLEVSAIGASNNSDTVNISDNVGKNWNIDVTHSGTEIGGVNILGNQFLIDDASYTPTRVIFINGCDHPNVQGNILIVTAAVSPEGITLANTCPYAIVAKNNIRYEGTSSTAIWFNAGSATLDGAQVVHNNVHYENVTTSTVRLAELQSLTTNGMLFGFNRVHVAAGGGNRRFLRSSPGSGSKLRLEGNIETGATNPDGWELEGAGITELVGNTIQRIENDAAMSSAGSFARGNVIDGQYGNIKETSGTITPSATIDTYGSEVDIFSAVPGNETNVYTRSNNIQGIAGSHTTASVVAETVTIRYTVHYTDNTTDNTLEKQETSNTTTSLTGDDVATMTKNNVAINRITGAMKSSIGSSTSSSTITIAGSTN